MDENNIDYAKPRMRVITTFTFITVFIIGIYIGYSKRDWVDRVSFVSNKQIPSGVTADFDPFWKTWNLINEKYPGARDVLNQDRIWGATQGLVSSLNDPYSEFFTPTETKNFNEAIEGTFGGIGMEVGIKDKLLTVISPIKGTPAEKSGIKPGDIILKINETQAAELSIDEAITLIRGEAGTKVSLAVFRDGVAEPLVFDITRDIIDVPVVDSRISGDVFVLNIYSFTGNIKERFEEEIFKFQDSGLKKLVLDVRGNPGGYLDAAIDISSYFLPEGTPIVIEDYGKEESRDVYRSYGYSLKNKNIKIAVLVDGGSASASEIIAGALSENGVAKLFGEQTYGKGSVQEIVPITNDTALKITVAKWLTPNGISISEKGLKPDFEVKLTKQDYEKKRDPVLARALDYLKTGK